MENIRDTVAQRHEYADWAQVEMTDKESWEKNEIKVTILEDCVDELQKMLDEKTRQWETQKQYILKLHEFIDGIELNHRKTIDLINLIKS